MSDGLHLWAAVASNFCDSAVILEPSTAEYHEKSYRSLCPFGLCRLGSSHGLAPSLVVRRPIDRSKSRWPRRTTGVPAVPPPGSLPPAAMVAPALLDSLTPEERVNVAVYEEANRGVVNITTRAVTRAVMSKFPPKARGAAW